MICEVVLLDEQHRPEVWPLSVSTADVRKIMRGVCKVVRPDNIPDRVLKTCQSTDFLTYIFIISLSGPPVHLSVTQPANMNYYYQLLT